MKMRRVKIKFLRKSGAVEVSIGKTRVLAATTADIVKPWPDRPSEGFLRIHTDFSPMASPFFENNRPSSRSIQLSRMVEKGIRESNAVDTESLCILSGSKVWEIRLDVRVIDDDGNIGDCASLAAVASLMHFRRPDVTVVGERVTVHSVEARQPIGLALHHIPIMITFAVFPVGGGGDKKAVESAGKAGGSSNSGSDVHVVIDPSRKETSVAQGEISFTVNKHKEICAIHKSGGIPLRPSKILKYANAAIVQAQKLTAQLEKELAREEKEQQARSRRGESVYTNPAAAFVENISRVTQEEETDVGGESAAAANDEMKDELGGADEKQAAETPTEKGTTSTDK
mmetsp:Transcript_16135/g.26648  ORF Transcript_16135/g.26648 Transcript_16135/m.26648 type:complete len:342 (-) Transcript_16135:73-1098(-)